MSNFKIPNTAAAGHPQQAAPDVTDFDILAAGISGTGVIGTWSGGGSGGCLVTANSLLTVAVAAGTIIVSGLGRVSVAAVASLAIGSNASGNDRKDLVVVSSAGVVSVVAGTASVAPVLKPALGTNSIALAEIYVINGATTIAAAEITDKRCLIQDEYFDIIRKLRRSRFR